MDRDALDRALDYVRSWLDWRQPRSDVPGIAVAVGLDGEVLLDAAWGVAVGAPFRIASHSKTFTATAVLQLAEAGALRLDDPVADHVPWLSEHHDRRFARVTLRQLLCHGSGIVRDGLDSDFWQMGRPFPDADGLRSEVLEADLVLDANVRLKYSNFGYGLLGLVIESASGRSYADYARQRLIDPAGLVATGPDVGDGPEGLVTGHGRRDPGGRRAEMPVIATGALAPATGFYGTAADLCRWMGALMTGSGKLLSDESKREMQRIHWRTWRAGRPDHRDYALGLDLDRIGERSTFGHSGGFPGHITRTAADQRDRLVVSVLTNCIDGPAEELVGGIFRVLDWFAKSEAPTARMRRLEGRYVNLWDAQDIVANGDRAAIVSPESWAPFAAPESLEAVDDATLRISETSSFGSEGELVRFDLRDGTVAGASFAGATCWSESAWPAAEARLLSGGAG